MRILQVLHSMDPASGGVCQSIRNFFPEFKNMNVETEIISLDSPHAEFLDTYGFQIHPLGPAPEPYSYTSRLQNWLQLNLLRFDAVILHGLWRYHSFGTYLAVQKFKKKHRKDIKIFVMPHGMLDPYFQKAEDRKLKAIRNYFFWKLIEQKVINGADGLLFTCDQELALAREPFSPYSPKKEINVGFGIQPPPPYEGKFRDAFFEKCPDLKTKSYLLFLSRIHPKKGVDILLKVYSELYTEHKDFPDLVIAGPGLETSYGKSLQRDFNNSSIHFPGMLSGDSKWGAFYCADAFVLPSHQENFGIAVVEALACGIPVLISKQVNIYKEIQRGRGGLIEEDTETGVTKMLRNWLRLPEDEKMTMAKNAYSVYEDNFIVGTATARMLHTISSITASKITAT